MTIRGQDLQMDLETKVVSIRVKVIDIQTRNCVSCCNFNEGTEICKLANERPPARVIVAGCDSWIDIPF